MLKMFQFFRPGIDQNSTVLNLSFKNVTVTTSTVNRQPTIWEKMIGKIPTATAMCRYNI